MPTTVSTSEIAIVSTVVVAFAVALWWVVRPKVSIRVEDDPTYEIRRTLIPTKYKRAVTAGRVAPVYYLPAAVAVPPRAITATRDPESTLAVLLARGDGRMRYPNTCENCRNGNHRQHVLSNGMCFNETCSCPPRTVWR